MSNAPKVIIKLHQHGENSLPSINGNVSFQIEVKNLHFTSNPWIGIFDRGTVPDARTNSFEDEPCIWQYLKPKEKLEIEEEELTKELVIPDKEVNLTTEFKEEGVSFISDPFGVILGNGYQRDPKNSYLGYSMTPGDYTVHFFDHDKYQSIYSLDVQIFGSWDFPLPLTTIPKDEFMSRRLDKFIGCEKTKTQFYELIHVLKAKQMGDTTFTIGHMAFKGNPGSGKTSFVKALFEVFKDHGFFPSTGSFLYFSDALELLDGESTTKRINELLVPIKKSGGMFVIDEAYNLVKPGNRKYGERALSALMSKMEDNDEATISNVVFVFIGYPAAIEELLEWNCGMRRRIRHIFDIEDYTSEHLLLMIIDFAQKQNQILMAGVIPTVREILNKPKVSILISQNNSAIASRLLEKAIYIRDKTLNLDSPCFDRNHLRTLMAMHFRIASIELYGQ